MSTYANPTTVIDRESGKIWSNTVNNIGKLTVGALDAIEKRRSAQAKSCLLYTSPSPRDRTRSRMPSSA